jgi:hypothetical protein
MGRQTVLGSQRSGLSSLIWLLIFIGLVVFVVRDPVLAGATAKNVWHGLVGAVDGIAAFIRNVFG